MSWQSHSLRDYAFVADGERGGLIGPQGDMSWLCFPRWDSPAVMSGLLGGGGGYHVHPDGRFVGGGWYEERTLIWVQRWITEDAEVESRSAFSLPGRHESLTILRTLTVLRGSADLDIALDVRAGFDRHKLRQATYDGTSWRARSDNVHVLWSGIGPDVEQTPGGALTAKPTLREGATLDLALVLSLDAEVETPDCSELWAATRDGWRRRVPDRKSRVTTRDSQHAYAVLSGLTADTGGTVAAATLGLPEKAGGGRSFDYRYVWIRDLCYVGQAVALGDDLALLDDAVRFVTARIEQYGEHLAPAYRIDGSPVPAEQPLELAGYPGGGGGVIGNWVNRQFQLDAWGEVLLLLAAADGRDRLGSDGWQAAEKATEVIAARWQEDDAGIWELEPAPWTHSRLMCAAGLRTIARRPSALYNAGRWAALADEIVADTSRTSLHRTGRWQRSPEDPRVDAALLLAGLRGAVAADDPRTLATLEAVLQQLTHDGYAYRFRYGDSPLGRTEGAFLLCAFLVSEALEQQGRYEESARWYERTRAACGTPGLFTEELDVQQRQLRGNLPQAFVHAMLLRMTLLHDQRLGLTQTG